MYIVVRLWYSFIVFLFFFFSSVFSIDELSEKEVEVKALCLSYMSCDHMFHVAYALCVPVD